MCVLESDILRTDGSERLLGMWTEWGAWWKLKGGRVPEGDKGNILISISNGRIPRFIGMDHMGHKPLRGRGTRVRGSYGS